ncbi:hypothetical protein NDU88_009033 [Pleurodeles waltl]|uniref:Uncharacterized protein n=1 Tax=Pleurodeles waltl TaxID=8319 RepID=A0AAV7RVG5_PLEWA|nr:hypothetical protein NDU88_009033 [Pleurodeles waltl]
MLHVRRLKALEIAKGDYLFVYKYWEHRRGHEAKDGARLIRLLRRGLNFSCYPGPPPGQIDGERVRGPVWATRAPVEPRASLAEPVGGGWRAPRPWACRRVNVGSRTERVSGYAAGRGTARRLRGSQPTAAGETGRPPSCLGVAAGLLVEGLVFQRPRRTV